jgi:Uma2 family endonuclease
MIDAGIFGPNDRLELLDGEVIDMSPQKSRHATAVTLVGEFMKVVFKQNATVRLQLPFLLDDNSEPEPDVAVVPGNPRDYRDAHPSRALLIVEVSDTTLAYDSGRKLAAYARAGIPEYWIVDLTGETLEVYRDPIKGTYAEQLSLQADQRAQPLAAGHVTLTVKDMLP